MEKQDFENAVRAVLRKIPLETRKAWTDADLFLWWSKTQAEDSYLTYEDARGSLWQYVPDMCNDMIGSDAIW